MKLDRYTPGSVRVEDQRGMTPGKQRILAELGEREVEARRLRDEAFKRAKQDRDARSNQRNQGK